jgi:hypothetical protein
MHLVTWSRRRPGKSIIWYLQFASTVNRRAAATTASLRLLHVLFVRLCCGWKGLHDRHAAARRGLSTTVTWFATPIVLGGLAILLLFCIVVLQSRVAKFRRDVHRLKEDFTAYRRDMKEKARTAP